MKYNPHEYQTYATNFILEHPVAAILLDMGLGKSVITLTAIKALMRDSFEVSSVLVIAPLRVATQTWPDEIEKWEHLYDLTYAVAVGTEAERQFQLRRNVDIHIINRENVKWFIEDSGLPFNYDMVVIDEASAYRNITTRRYKTMLRLTKDMPRLVLMTGTPCPEAPTDAYGLARLLHVENLLAEGDHHGYRRPPRT